MRRLAKGMSSFSSGRCGLPALLWLVLLALAVVPSAVRPDSAAAAKVVYDVIGSASTGTLGGQFNNPRGVAVNVNGTGGASAGDVYVVDGSNNRVQQFTAKGAFVRAFGQDVETSTNEVQTVAVNAGAGDFKLTFNGQTTGDLPFNVPALGGVGPTASLQNALNALSSVAPGAVAVSGGPGAPGGGTYIVTFSTGASLIGTDVPEITHTAGTTGLSGGSGAGADTVAIATTTQGGGASTGFEVCTIAARCKAGLTSPTTANGGQLNNPGWIAVEQSTGNVFVTESGNRRISVFSATGAFFRLFGGDVVSTGAPENVATNAFEVCLTPANCKTAALSGPSGGQFSSAGGSIGSLAFNPLTGNLLAADPSNRRVQEFTPAGVTPAASFVRLWGWDVIATTKPGDLGANVFEICTSIVVGDCRAHPTGAPSSGLGAFASTQPARVAADSTGAIFTVEPGGNFRVQKFTPAGASLTPSLFDPPIGVQPTISLSGTAAADAPQDIAVGAGDRTFVVKACNQAGCPNGPLGSERRIYEFDATGSLQETHLAGAGINVVNGIAANPANDRLYLTSTSDGHRVLILTDPPDLAPAPVTAAAALAGHRATLAGSVNPNGFKLTECRFEYGPTSSYGRTAPCQPTPAVIGDGTAAVSVTALTGPLEPGTVYRYRLFAANGGQQAQGKERTFATGPGPADGCANATIRAEQGIEVMLLPGCLALEQVSPASKGNQPARAGGGNLQNSAAIAAGGDRVLYGAVATLGECTVLNALGGGESYVATRDPAAGGWSSECTTPPYNAEFEDRLRVLSFDPGLSRWFQAIQTGGARDPRFTHQSLDAPPSIFTPLLVNLVGDFKTNVHLHGASRDHSRVFFAPEKRGGAFENARTLKYLAGDPEPGGTGEDSNLYLGRLDSAGAPVLELLARDFSGKVWGARCGARLGGFETLPASGNGNLANGERSQGAVSPDGSRVYFSTRPGQEGAGLCDGALNKKRIMVREETTTGPVISELLASECGRVAPPCSASDGDDVYQGASVDQSKVYFTTTRQLADTDLDAPAASCAATVAVPGCDLYLYDEGKPAGQRLTQVSAGESTAASKGEGAAVRNSITAISGDGSRAYFVAQTVLTTDPNPVGVTAQGGQPNLYAFDAADGDLAFVGTLAPGDGGADVGLAGIFGTARAGNWQNEAYAAPVTGTDGQGREVGGDGRVLLFNTLAPLAPEDGDAVADLYRYDAEAGALDLVSVAAPGGSDDGSAPVLLSDLWRGSPGTDFAVMGRWVSEDGDSVVFSTAEALLPGDTDGAQDSYLWREGELFQLPGTTRSGTLANAYPIRPIVSPDGATIVYHTDERLTFSDGDTVDDVYALRAGGGFSAPSVGGCEGEACQGPPASVPTAPGPITAGAQSSGNVRPPATRRCPKGKRRVVGRGGRVRCVRAAKHRKHAAKRKAAAKSRANAEHGGRK